MEMQITRVQNIGFRQTSEMLIIIKAMPFYNNIKFCSFHISRVSIPVAQLRQGVV